MPLPLPRLRPLLVGLFPCISVLCTPILSHADSSPASEPVNIPEMEVVEEYISPTRQVTDSLATGTMVTQSGLELGGPSAKVNVYDSIDILPGIMVQGTDPYGLGMTQSRIRSVKGMLGGMTVEGIPNYGIMPIGPRAGIYDMENVREIALYRGGTPADLMAGSGNKAGAIELRMRRPSKAPAAEADLSVGTDDYTRGFIRIDSGTLPGAFSLFASASRTDADKWKGPGDLGPRDHLTGGMRWEPGERFTADVFFSFNESETDDFRPFTFGEARKIEDLRRMDYNERFTGTPKEDALYYKYHTREAINRDLFGVMEAKLADKILFTLKPYYSHETGDTLEGTLAGSTPIVKGGVVDLDRYGTISELSGEFSGVKSTIGLWHESFDLEKYVRKSVITPDGLVSQGYAYYAENHGRGTTLSPFFKVSQELGRWRWQAGARYFSYEEPASAGYKTPPPAFRLVKDPATSLDEMDYTAFLPSAGLGYSFTDALEGYLTYGRNYVRPYMYVPITNLYVQNKAAFEKAGITLQDIFDDWEMETSDTADLGLRFTEGPLEIDATLFYAWHHDVLANVADSRVAGVSYYQNAGEARSYGAELIACARPASSLTVFVHPSLTYMRFDDDIIRGGKTLNLAGKDYPDAPRWNVKTGIIWNWEGIEIAPQLTWMSKRYGDALNVEEIHTPALVDLSVSYSTKGILGLKEGRIGLDITNLFDEEYISIIDLMDDNGPGSASYYAGPPFSAVFSISGRY
ncbi:MAG: TonB-dependent receptor [Deltaproteobacteria bacterium]